MANERDGLALSSLNQRIISGTTAILIIGVSLWRAPIWFFSLGVGLVIIRGLFEFFTMMRARGASVFRFFGTIVGATIPFTVFFRFGESQSGEVLFIVLSCFGLFLIQFIRKEDGHTLEGISLTLLGMMYISWFLSFLIKIIFMDGGRFLIAYLLVVTKIGDIAAFGVGSLWGKHNLIPHISPKKTVEGTVAGVVLSMLLSCAFKNVLPFEISLLHLAVLGLLIGLVAQCGDLSESLIKRYCGLKDSGKIIPGFGGVLDVADSVLFTAPIFYFYVKVYH
jgi:phosphatidate cytidylyltransferase